MNVRDSFNAAQSHAIQVHLDAQLHRPSSATVGRIRKLTTAVLAHMNCRSLRRPFLTVSVELQFGHFISLFCHSHYCASNANSLAEMALRCGLVKFQSHRELRSPFSAGFLNCIVELKPHLYRRSDGEFHLPKTKRQSKGQR